MDEYKKKTNTGDYVYVRIQPPRPDVESCPTPTVVLLGWFASKPKHVAKYSAIWEAMGYNTVQTTAPISVVFPLTQRIPAIYLLSILRIIAADKRLTDGGLVFQMFSNGGAITAPHLSRMFNYVDCNDVTVGSSSPNSKLGYLDFIKTDDREVIEKVKRAHAALVFDSSPIYLRDELGYRAINEGLGINGSLFSYVIVVVFTFLCHLQRMFIYNLPEDFWTGVTDAKYPCPELYIYSRADHLLDVPSLEAMIEHRKQNGRSIRVFDVEDAPHVAIFRKYPDKYGETIREVNEWGTNAWRQLAAVPSWQSLGASSTGIGS